MNKSNKFCNYHNLEKLEPKFASKEEVIKEIEKIYNKNLISIYSFLDKFIKTKTGKDNINGCNAGDIMQMATEKFISDKMPEEKRRRWNKTKYPEFLKCYINACLSLISNEIKKFKRKKDRIFILEIVDDDEYNEHEYIKLDQNDQKAEYEFNPETYDDYNIYSYGIDENYSVCKKIYNDYILNEYSNNDSQLTYEDNEIIIKKLEEALSKNNIAPKIFELILEGIRKPKEIAKILNIPIKIVNYNKKQIFKKFFKILGEYKNERKIS